MCVCQRHESRNDGGIYIYICINLGAGFPLQIRLVVSQTIFKMHPSPRLAPEFFGLHSLGRE